MLTALDNSNAVLTHLLMVDRWEHSSHHLHLVLPALVLIPLTLLVWTHFLSSHHFWSWSLEGDYSLLRFTLSSFKRETPLTLWKGYMLIRSFHFHSWLFPSPYFEDSSLRVQDQLYGQWSTLWFMMNWTLFPSSPFFLYLESFQLSAVVYSSLPG